MYNKNGLVPNPYEVRHSSRGQKVFAFLVIKNNEPKGVIISPFLTRSMDGARAIFKSVCRNSDPHYDVVQLHQFSDDRTETWVVMHWGSHPSWFEDVRKEVSNV